MTRCRSSGGARSRITRSMTSPRTNRPSAPITRNIVSLTAPGPAVQASPTSTATSTSLSRREAPRARLPNSHARRTAGSARRPRVRSSHNRRDGPRPAVSGTSMETPIYQSAVRRAAAGVLRGLTGEASRSRRHPRPRPGAASLRQGEGERQPNHLKIQDFGRRRFVLSLSVSHNARNPGNRPPATAQDTRSGGARAPRHPPAVAEALAAVRALQLGLRRRAGVTRAVRVHRGDGRGAPVQGAGGAGGVMARGCVGVQPEACSTVRQDASTGGRVHRSPIRHVRPHWTHRQRKASSSRVRRTGAAH